jgi:hypothetical protein
MIRLIFAVFLIILSFNLLSGQPFLKPNRDYIQKIKSTDGIVALWTFSEKPGKARKSVVNDKFPLSEANGKIRRFDDGPLSGYSALFEGNNYLSLPNKMTGNLNIHGKDRGVTVIAWIKWDGTQTGFIGGMWNEYQDGGKRQYGLFVSLPHYNGNDQVCGHISWTGKPTPPFPYSIDYSASNQTVMAGEWSCVAFTYDGQYIRSYLNGEFKAREPELIRNTKGFEGYPDGLIQSKNPYSFPGWHGKQRF